MTAGRHDGAGRGVDGQPSAAAASADDARPRSKTLHVSLAIIAALMFAGFFALGTWQVFRLQWKLDLIERVDQRVHAAPVAPPGPAHWSRVSADGDEYRHVRLDGAYLMAQTTRVQASTELGPGYWLLTPLCTADGAVVIVNRGYVPNRRGDFDQPAPPAAARDACAQALAGGAHASVTGLLRMNEPRGRFMQDNDARAERWYSRDVYAIAAARGLSVSPAELAPYFIDAGADPVHAGVPDRAKAASAAHPVGGLTVISFPNSHLVYALTWYALALMVVGATVLFRRETRKGRRS